MVRSKQITSLQIVTPADLLIAKIITLPHFSTTIPHEIHLIHEIHSTWPPQSDLSVEGPLSEVVICTEKVD